MIIEAILKINPNACCVVKNDDIDNIEWHNGTKPISKQDILDMLPQVELDMAFALLRQKRNSLLAATDYLALSDQQMSEQMKSYRQQLRELTEGLDTVDQVNNVTYPIKPNN